MVLGSSSVPSLAAPGKKLRWAALLVLAVVAVVLAFRSRGGPRRPPRVVVWLAVWLAALGVCSSTWSVDPRLTFGRAGSFALLIVAALALAFAAGTRDRLPGRVLDGVLAGACAAAVAGLVLLVPAYRDAVAAGTPSYPARFEGLGENPDTVAMLEGLAAPIALWGLLQARSRGRQLLHLGAVVLLIGSISASGSRGGLLAAFVGGIVLSLSLRQSLRRRAVLAFAVCLAMLAATAGTQIPKPLTAEQYAKATGTQAATPAKGGAAAIPAQPSGTAISQYAGRLADELYRSASEQRSLLSSSGRLEAWQGAVEQADARPLLGYGFGTENMVFIDRVANFDGSYVENSFIGLYLQLGAVGLVSFCALLLAVAVAGLHRLRRAEADVPVPPLAAVVGAGLVLMLVQSYAYSVGNVATASFWVACLVFATVAAAPGRQRLDAGVRTPEGTVATV